MLSDFDRRFRMHSMIITIMGCVVLTIALGILATVAYLGITCYNSNDPHSMACYMLSPRVMVVDK